MRMWMVDEKVLCRKHLLGEHVELHMLVGHLSRGRHVRGYVENNCIELESVQSRHEALAREIVGRGYTHKSQLRFESQHVDHLTEFELLSRVDRAASLADLIGRCPECRARHGEICDLLLDCRTWT